MKKAVLTLLGYNPGKRINELSTARRTSCSCWNLAEQKTLLLAYSLTPLPLSQPQFVHTHTPSHSRFFSPPLIILHGNSYIGGAKWFTPELSLPAQPLKTTTSSGRKEQPCMLPSASTVQKAPDKNERRLQRRECRSWRAIKRPSQQNQRFKKLQLGLPLLAEKL